MSSSFSSRRGRSRSRGFTLVEILTVLAIVGLLIGVVVSNTDKIFGQSQESVARIFVRDSLKTSLVRYRMDLGDYPTTAEGLNALVAPTASNSDRWKGPYMDATGGKVPLDPWGQPYEYRYPGVKNVGGYDLFSKGPDKIADTADDIGNW
ncbi:MAG TPA: type II secretion system major pseudopilin GspG [Lacunisphaera sp.]|jgi:general secretion pathway protein G|nr:type II secretion system major pseudopilin GspG [Lacunisphaera sp.]